MPAPLSVIRAAAASLALLIAVGASARAQAVLDLSALPAHIGQDGLAAYRHFLILNLPRAFAIAGNGAVGFSGGGGTQAERRARALAQCQQKAPDCRLYAVDLDVVWPGRPPETRPAVPGPLIQDRFYAFIPDKRFFWHGPEKAAGLYVWSHGKDEGGKDLRGIQPQEHVRMFNNAGYDIVRFDRDPYGDQVNAAEGWLREGLAELRRRGWKRIIAGGQSRGAWNSLQLLAAGDGLAEVVIAMSPAANGTNPGRVNTIGVVQTRAIAEAANAPRTRVLVAQFNDDPFAGDETARAAMFREILAPHVGAFVLIDRPAGFSGHDAGGNFLFAERYADCIFRFATAPAPPASCP
jgi:hypothetical protein